MADEDWTVRFNYPKILGILFLIITTALLLNVFMIAGAAKMYGYTAFPLEKILLWIFPVSLILALITARWVKGLIKKADE